MTTTLGDLLIDVGRGFPDAQAVREPTGGWTYRQLGRAADDLAAVIRGSGVEGERIGILLQNGTAFAIALHAILRCGGSALLLNPLNSPREIAEQLTDAEVRTVLADESLAPHLPPEVQTIVVDERGGGTAARSSSAPARAAGHNAVRRPRAEDEAVVIFTAAMGGRSRGAVLSHRNLIASLRSTTEALALERGDRVLGMLPYAHAFGLTVCLNAPLARAATLLPMARFSPTAALDAIENEGVSVLCGVPAMYVGMLRAAEKRGAVRHRLRVVLSGGASLPLEVARQWEAVFGIPLRQGYGLTEAAPVCLFNHVERPNHIGTLGEPVPGVEVSIRDPTGAPLERGEVGELWVRGPNVFAGYLDEQGEGTSAVVDGWLRTGDLASSDGEVVRFGGILKKMFTRSGFNVYPEEVRRALLEDPHIAEVEVGARPDPVRENEVILTVVPALGARLSEDDVRGICTRRLAAYKRPSVIRISSAEEYAASRRPS